MEGQTVLITGASGGLGRTVSQAFLSAGATVAGTARRWKPEEAPPGEFVALEADLTQGAWVEQTVQSVLKETGRLDAVVHLMGGFAGGKQVSETPEETWDQMMNVNLRSAFLVFRHTLPVLMAQKRGRVVAVGSRGGTQPSPGMGAYAVSKAGLHALVQTAGEEVKGWGVTVNAVLPSTIDTEVNRAAMPKADFSKWVSPASLAQVLLWLVSDAAHDVNGALIPVYGGV